MLRQDQKKELNKVNERAVNPKSPVAIRNGKRIHWRAVFATICITLLVILGTIIVNSSSSKTVAHAYSMNGIGVGIYWDQACTNRTLSLDWGPIEPGSNSTAMIYVRNEGDSTVSLRMTTSNWTPSAAIGNMTLVWAYSGRTLSAGEVIPIDLTLDVSPTISGVTDFSFGIVITATG